MASFDSAPVLPVLTLQATIAGLAAEFNLPVATLVGTLEAGPAFGGAFPLPRVQVSASLLAGNVLDTSFALPVAALSANVLAPSAFTAVFTLPALRGSSSFLPGQIFTAAPALPAITVAASILSIGSFDASFELPTIQLNAQLYTILAGTYRTWVLNTRKAALTEYDFQFNSYAVFNGLVLAVGPSGIVILGTQNLDNAAAIAAKLRTGKADYDTALLKRIPRIYAGVKAAGNLLFRTITSEGGERTYRLVNNHLADLQQRRVPVGKGPKSRFWQYEIENEGGADFSLKDILVYPTVLRRRVQ